MCRAIAEGGRRCPGCSNREVEHALTSVKRFERQLADLEDDDTISADDPRYEAKVARYLDAVNRLTERERARGIAKAERDFPPSAGTGWITPEAVEAMPAETVETTKQALWADPEAAYALEVAACDDPLRDSLWTREGEGRPLELADDDELGEDAGEVDEWDEIGALAAANGLTRDEYAREEWERYQLNAYCAAEEETGGSLLTREARDAGIDAYSLFSGSADRAARYASDELKAWWQANGRHTVASHRYQLLKRDSDKQAYESATITARFDDAAAVL